VLKHFLISLFAVIGVSACKDSCRKSHCENVSYCYNGECICAKWYSGDKCQLFFNRNYEGLYEGRETEGVRSTAVQYFLAADEKLPNRMNLEFEIYLDFDSDSTLVIPVQKFVDGKDTNWISGKGAYGIDFIAFQFGVFNLSTEEYTDEPMVNFIGARIAEGQ
jgi:hypothetical protein